MTPEVFFLLLFIYAGINYFLWNTFKMFSTSSMFNWTAHRVQLNALNSNDIPNKGFKCFELG